MKKTISIFVISCCFLSWLQFAVGKCVFLREVSISQKNIVRDPGERFRPFLKNKSLFKRRLLHTNSSFVPSPAGRFYVVLPAASFISIIQDSRVSSPTHLSPHLRAPPLL